MRLCDECSDPVDPDPNGNAHHDGDLWWHPECCPDCAAGLPDLDAPATVREKENAR